MTSPEDGETNDQNDEKTALKAANRDEGAVGDIAFPQKDPMAVMFVNGSKPDDVLIDFKTKDAGNEFVGLKKDELAKYAKDPYWVRLRIVLLVVVAVAWLAMLVAAIVIVVLAPKCPPRPDQDWWETAVIYQVNPNSFLDTNGDGKGDIKGIHEKVDYLKDTLKVTALNLGPIYPSPRANFGYDITNHASICGHYGTMDDFDSLRTSMHKRGMKLILDFIPNHTSRKHKWFNGSRNVSGGSNQYKDFYIWNPGKTSSDGTRQPPNEWLNAYNESAWTLDEARNEFYYHSYTKDEPDLNLLNEKVVAELDTALMFWLNKKVDGFRFIGVNRLVEPLPDTDESNTVVQQKTYELIVHWRELILNYSSSPDLPKSRRFPRLLIADVSGDANETAKFFEYNGKPGAHLPTNKVLHGLNQDCSTNCIYSLVKSWSEVVEPNYKISNWQVGNLETNRVASRMGDRSYINALSLLLLTLPGATMVYYGDELGMKDSVLSPNMSLALPSESLSRAEQLGPMLWSDKPYAGFSSVEPWIPVADDYHEINVEAQLAHGSGMSHIKVFESLVKLKDEPSFQWGRMHIDYRKSVLFYVRQAEGFSGYLVAINFGPLPSTINFKDSSLKDLLPDSAAVVASTHNFDEAGRSKNYDVDTAVDLNSIVLLKPTEGIVLKFELPTSLF